jgi:hypothetical protein
MIHVNDTEIKEKLLEIAPQDKEAIERTEFGEIVTPYVSALIFRPFPQVSGL